MTRFWIRCDHCGENKEVSRSYIQQTDAGVQRCIVIRDPRKSGPSHLVSSQSEVQKAQICGSCQDKIKSDPEILAAYKRSDSYAWRTEAS